MRRMEGDAKRKLWRERLARFARSGQTVTAFCSAERVSMPTFYEWRRKLAAVSVSGKRRRAIPAVPVGRAPAFLPVQIEGAALVEMNLPNGTRVRVPANDLGLIGAVIAAAGRVPARVEAESPPC